MSNAIDVDAPTLDDTLNERHRKKSDIARNGSDVTFPMAARCLVSRPNAATEGDRLALTVARSIRTWKYRAPGRETGWTPKEDQLSKALQPGPFGFESFPDRRLNRPDAGCVDEIPIEGEHRAAGTWRRGACFDDGLRHCRGFVEGLRVRKSKVVEVDESASDVSAVDPQDHILKAGALGGRADLVQVDHDLLPAQTQRLSDGRPR